MIYERGTGREARADEIDTIGAKRWVYLPPGWQPKLDEDGTWPDRCPIWRPA